MHTPFPSRSDPLKPVRVGLAVLLTGSTLVLTGTIAIQLYSATKIQQQQRIDQQHQGILNRVNDLKNSGNYGTCISEAQTIPTDSLFASQAQTLADQCKTLIRTTLEQAQGLAEAGQLQEAIEKVAIIADSSAAVEVRKDIENWSAQILQIAEGYYLDPAGRMENAIRTANAIRSNNPLYSEAQSRIKQWRHEWLNNQIYWQSAETAFNTDQPDAALAQIQKINHPYWQQRVAEIANAIYTKKAEAEKLAAELAAEKALATAAIDSQARSQLAQPVEPPMLFQEPTTSDMAWPIKVLLPISISVLLFSGSLRQK